MASTSPRCRFQFSLRTLLIGVTLLAIVCDFCGYIGRQAEIVNERKVLLRRIVSLGGSYNNISRKYFGDLRAVYLRGGTPSPALGHPVVPPIRMFLGDEVIQLVALPPDAPLYDEVRATFPDAAIVLMGPPPF
jgi:hypothetical protein